MLDVIVVRETMEAKATVVTNHAVNTIAHIGGKIVHKTRQEQ